MNPALSGAAPAPPRLPDPYTGEPSQLAFVARDNRGLPGAFPYYRSPRGHLFIGAVPDNLGDHYAGGYQAIPATEAELATMAEGDAYRLDPVRALVPEGDFLEIGSWIGLVAYSAKRAGYRVHVLEREQRCIDLLQGAGINAMRTDDPAQALTESDRTYDVIGMWHSIEHLPRPWAVIEAAARRLRPGGLLVIAAPNPESLQLKLLQEHWLHLDAPRHLHFLPAAMVEEIGATNGLTLVERTTDDILARIVERDAWNHEAFRQVRFLPIVSRIWRRMAFGHLSRKRRPGGFDGAGYTIMMRKDKPAHKADRIETLRAMAKD